jgi:hypothetical protein
MITTANPSGKPGEAHASADVVFDVSAVERGVVM